MTEDNLFLRLYISYKLSLGDATSICHQKIKEIKKTGGGRQRSEGIKLLNRIIFHLDNLKYWMKYE